MDALSIIAKNRNADLDKLGVLAKRFPAYADELARLLLSDTLEATDEELELSYREVKEALICDTHGQSGFSEHLIAAEGALLAAEIAKTLVERAKIHTFLPTPDSVDGKCVYFRSAYADMAYRVFAPLLTTPTASYSDSPQAACREVYNEAANFAILPISSSKEGVITGIAKQIARFELAPVYLCDVTLPKSDETVTMGLFAAYPMAVDAADGVEVILFSEDHKTLSSLMLSLTALNVSVRSLETLDATQGFAFAHRLVLRLFDPESFLPLWLLLRCEYPHHQLCGVFHTILNS